MFGFLRDVARWGMPSNWGDYPARFLELYRHVEEAAKAAAELERMQADAVKEAAAGEG